MRKKEREGKRKEEEEEEQERILKTFDVKYVSVESATQNKAAPKRMGQKGCAKKDAPKSSILFYMQMYSHITLLDI